LLKLIAFAALILSLFGQIVLLSGLVAQNIFVDMPGTWLFLHTVASIVSALAINVFISDLIPNKNKPFNVYCFFICLSMPFIGTVGCLGAMLYGIYHSNNRHEQAR